MMRNDDLIAELSYHLSAEDYYTCLKSGKVFRHSGVRAWIETGILTAIGTGYLISYLFYEKAGMSLFLFLVCAVFIGVLWLLPEYSMRSTAKKQGVNKKFVAQVRSDRVIIGQGDGKWELPLDKTSYFWETEALFVLEDDRQNMTALPKAVMDPETEEAVRIALMRGMTHGAPKRHRR